MTSQRRGRPPKPPEERRDQWVKIRVSSADLARWDGLDVTEVCRAALDRAARKREREAAAGGG